MLRIPIVRLAACSTSNVTSVGVSRYYDMGNTVMVNRTGAVGLYCGPGGVGLALPGGGATEQVAVHAGVDD